MIPSLIKISGFLSYHEAVELDFSEFDLACISGANGAGKSSLLDAITWSLFGQARRKDDALINSRKDAAEVIFDFHYENNFYRVQRSKTRGKNSSLEFFIRKPDGSWKTLTEHSMRETDAHIQNTLRLDYETFSNVSFFLQGKADQFAQQRPGDRKRILGNILGLEKWEVYRDRTAQQRRETESRLAILNSQLEEIHNELQLESERRSHLSELEENLKQLSESRKAQGSIIDNMRQLQAAHTEQKRMVRALFEQLETAQKRLEAQKNQLQLKQKEIQLYESKIESESEIETAYQNWQNARQELKNWDAIAADFHQYDSQRAEPLLAIEGEKARLEQQRSGYLDMEKQAALAGEELEQLKKDISLAENELARLSQNMGKRQELEQRLRSLLEEQSQSTAENNALRIEMNELKERIDRLKESEGVSCPVCGQPLSPDERDQLVNRLKSRGKEMGDRYRLNLNQINSFQENTENAEKDLTGLQKVEEAYYQQQRLIDQMSNRRQQLETTINEWQQTHAQKLDEINRVLAESSFSQDARQKLAEIDEHLKQLGYDAAAHDAVRQAEQDGNNSEEQLRMLQSAKAALEPLKGVISDLTRQIAADESEVVRQQESYRQSEEKLKSDEAALPDIQQAENELYALQEKENILRTEIGAAIQRVEVLQSLKKRQVDLNAQKEDLNLQISRLKTLERAFGNDGIPALLIEQALPEIEEQTNDILDRLSGGKMTVRFLTQRDYKNKQREDKKETLDILISDSAGIREYEMFSGGESFRINFAIRLALSRVLAQRAGARLQTLVIDEGFGNQDAEGRQRLLEAINLVKPDFAKILVITHIEEMKDAFPARIEVEKNGAGSNLSVVL